ncbi:hypothetical protein [Natronorubrum aibiense]|nr:hypothetical protein [Natronorubrum aibiense]
MLDSSTRALEVRFTVKGIRIAVTSDGVNVLADEPANAEISSAIT